MRRNPDKDTTAVLIHIESSLYDKYLKTLDERHLKRQAHSAEVFEKAIEEEIKRHYKKK